YVLQDKDIPRGKFRIPYLNSKYIMHIGVLVGLVLLLTYDTDGFVKFVKNTPEVYEPQMLITELDSVNTQLLIQDVVVSFNELYNQNSNDLEATLQHLFTNHPNEYISLLSNRLETEQMYHSGWSLFLHKIPLWLFAFALIGLSYWSYIKNLSLIPMLGLVCCLYMMCELTVWNWLYFSVWLMIGLSIYFLY